MPTICAIANIAYFPVPKVACTSLKILFYQLNNSVKWHGSRHVFGPIHSAPGYHSAPFNEETFSALSNYKRIAVVRNPVERALSAYRDKARKVVLAGTKAEENLKLAGLPLEPDPELFFDEIEQYFECAPLIREHMRPFSYYLGQDLASFDKVFKLEELNELGEYLGQNIGRPVELLSSNSSKKSVNAQKVVSSETLKKAIKFVGEDFEYLSDFYQI